MAKLGSPLGLFLLIGVASAVPQTDRVKCPQVCSEAQQAVCGSNNVVYRNRCYLQRAACTTFPGLTVKHEGPCVNQGGSSSASRPGSAAASSSSSSRCRQECTKIYLPVCGSDGKTYNNMCLLRVQNCLNKEQGLPEITIRYENACDVEEVSTDVCARQCSDVFEPACGSDRITYYNKCELSVAMCRDDQVKLHHEGTCAGFSGRGAGRPSKQRDNDSSSSSSAPSSSVVSEYCPDTCTGGFRPVCGTNNITYGSDCYLEIAKCRYPSLAKKADGVCTKDCTLQCDTARDLVCGTDGITYTNYCFLLLAKCKDPAVAWQQNGPCVFVEREECRPHRCGNRGKAMCGSDGITYRNRCLFDAATCYNQGLLKLYDGPCKPDPRVCGKCEDNTRRLVCGSDGVTYQNHCHLILQACLSRYDIYKVADGPCLRKRY